MKTSGVPPWIKYAGLAVAGITSFYMAFQFSRHRAAVDDDTDLLARPTLVVKQEVANRAPYNQSVAHQDQLRLSPSVEQDAFAPLNTSITIEQLTAPPPPAHSMRRRTSKKEAPAPTPVVTAPPASAPVVAVAPTAPALPFKVLGAVHGAEIANGHRTVFLSTSGSPSVLVVKDGDVINGTYKVTALTESQIDFLYLPLQTPQSLRIDK